jgi:hypothetical protein
MNIMFPMERMKLYKLNSMLHVKDISIPKNYRDLSLHIALERADLNRDWVVFKKLYQFNPVFLKFHLDSTTSVFNYNYKSLPEEEQNNLFV